MKEILLLKAEVAVDVEEGSVFQHVNFIKFFCRKTCILQYTRMVSKAGQKTFKWSGFSRRMHLINFDKFNLLFPIQAQVSSTLFGGGICSSSPCNLYTESKYEQYTTGVSESVLFGTVYETSTLYGQNLVHTRPQWKSKLYFCLRPCKSSTWRISSDRLQITNQNPQAKRILPAL